MSSINNLTNIANKSYSLKERVSNAEKIANNYEWVRNKVDELNSLALLRTAEKQKMELNYKLINGEYDESVFEYLWKPYKYESDIKTAKFKHMDIISSPLREIIGEEERRPFDPSVIGVNGEAVIARRTEKAKLVSQYIQNSLINKLKAQEEQGTLSEEQKQISLGEIEEHIKKEFKLPEETQAQQLLNWLIKKEKLKFKFNQGWGDVIKVDREIYYITTRNGHPVVELVNPMEIIYSNSPDNFFIQDSNWVVRERMRSITDIYNDYSDIEEKDRKILDDYLHNNMSNDNGLRSGILIDYQDVVYDVSNYNRYIREAHFVFKTLKKVKFIKTITENGVEDLIVDETYEFNPMIDLEETIVWIPEAWEATLLGSEVYINIRPLPNQYSNLSDPYNVKLPYIGAIYNNRNAESVSLLDRAKTWDYMFNAIFYRLEEAIGTDLGNVMLAVNNMLPTDWSPEKWLAFVKATKIALVQTHKEGEAMASGTDPQYWKSLNMSANNDISKYINILQFCQEQCYQAIGTNPGRIGSQATSETVGNNQQRIIQSANITEPLFSIHNMIKEQVCTALIQEAKFAYRNNKQAIAHVLDDNSIALLDLDTSGLSLMELGVFVSNSVEDFNMLQQLRNNVQALVQNSDGDLRMAVKVLRTKNPSALDTFIEEKYKEIQAQQQQKIQSEQAALEAEAKERQLDRELELRIAMIRAMGYMNDSDVNKDLIPDVLQMEKFNKEFQLKFEELRLRERELTENNKSEAADREVEREKIAAQKNKVTSSK